MVHPGKACSKQCENTKTVRLCGMAYVFDTGYQQAKALCEEVREALEEKSVV